jgi:hypothetical protein
MAKFSAVPAAPPSGRTFATALPVKLSVSPRRLVKPGNDAASTNEWDHNPAIHTIVRSTNDPGETRVRTTPTSLQVAPTARGSRTTKTTVISPLMTDVTKRLRRVRSIVTPGRCSLCLIDPSLDSRR